MQRRSRSPSRSAEAGAMFAGGLYLTHYADLLGVEIVRPEPDERAFLYHLRGRGIRGAPGAPVEWPLELTPEWRHVGREGLWRKYVEPVIAELGNPLAPGWPPASLHEYDRMSYVEFLRSRGASPAAIVLMTLGTTNLSARVA